MRDPNNIDYARKKNLTFSNPKNFLNKNLELISKCYYEAKHLLCNMVPD